MNKYMFVYKGPATPSEEMDEDKANEIMEAWQVWMDGIGDSLVDMGMPMGESYSLLDDSSEGTAAELTGYSVVQAEDMAGAKALAENHPFLSEGKGNFAIDIFELQPMPGMN